MLITAPSWHSFPTYFLGSHVALARNRKTRKNSHTRKKSGFFSKNSRIVSKMSILRLTFVNHTPVIQRSNFLSNNCDSRKTPHGWK